MKEIILQQCSGSLELIKNSDIRAKLIKNGSILKRKSSFGNFYLEREHLSIYKEYVVSNQFGKKKSFTTFKEALKAFKKDFN